MIWRTVIALALLTLGVNAQDDIFVPIQAFSQQSTVFVTDQNIFDLNAQRDAITGTTGEVRIRANFWEDASFSDVLDVSVGLPIRLVIKSRTDDYQVSILSSITSAPPNTVWWVTPFLNAGEYELNASITLPDDTFPVFQRYMTLTNIPSAAAVININSNAVQVSVPVTITNVTTINYYGGSVTNL